MNSKQKVVPDAKEEDISDNKNYKCISLSREKLDQILKDALDEVTEETNTKEEDLMEELNRIASRYFRKREEVRNFSGLCDKE